MLKILLVIIISFSISAQNQIQIYHFNYDENSFRFEKQFIEEIILLYNKRNKNNTFKLKFIATKTFTDLFTSLSTKDSNSMALSGITVTENRKKLFDFSPIYLPVKNAIVTLKNSKITEENWNKNGFKLGYYKNTVQVDLANSLQSKYDINIVEFDLLDNSLLKSLIESKKVDMVFVEGMDLTNDDKFKQLRVFIDKSIGYGIMYPKNSPLKNKLKPFISYYIHSKHYYTLLKKTYGDEISEQIFKKLN